MSAKGYLAPWGRAAAAARAAAGGGGGGTAEALAALEGKAAIHHCVSRAVWREMAFGEAEKERFVRALRKWGAFSLVRVLTYCVMGNHFHVLVEVPERPGKGPPDGELLEHLGLIYGAGRLAGIRRELGQCRGQGDHGAAAALRERYLRRMRELSVFMKAVKQEFTVWWNRRHGKEGNLWQDKFRSVLVEEGHAARVVAGHIDLNPVRAGMVGEAGSYRWSGWGEAVAGVRAREGVAAVMPGRGLGRPGAVEAAAAVADRREALAGCGRLPAEEARKRGGGGGGVRRGAAGAGAPGGGVRGARRLTEEEMLGLRVRYFVDGLVVGTAGFVDGVFLLTRGWFGAGRRSGARRLAGAETPLRTMRVPRVVPFG